jgi:hypothetical protein
LVLGAPFVVGANATAARALAVPVAEPGKLPQQHLPLGHQPLPSTPHTLAKNCINVLFINPLRQRAKQ